jgi:hypothetical protein
VRCGTSTDIGRPRGDGLPRRPVLPSRFISFSAPSSSVTSQLRKRVRRATCSSSATGLGRTHPPTRMDRRTFQAISRIASFAPCRVTHVRSLPPSPGLRFLLRARSCNAPFSAILKSSTLTRWRASTHEGLPRTLTLSADPFKPAFGISIPCNEVACNVDPSETMDTAGQLGADAAVPCGDGCSADP